MLLDCGIDHLVTPKLIKVFYLMTLLLVTVSALMVVSVGLWIFQLRNGWLVGLFVVLSAPSLWVFEVLLVRIFMESLVVRIKGVEHLGAIKDKL